MNRYITILFLLLLVSCHHKQKTSFSKHTIEFIANESPNYPSKFSNTSFYGKSFDNKIITMNVYELKEIYSSSHSKISYSDFLTQLLGQRVIVSDTVGGKLFTLDKQIEEKYSAMDFSSFLKEFCETANNHRYYLKHEITENQRNSILYFLFINNYLNYFDDISGTYTIKKQE
jgi:hypothetical protein